jgi:hypothetical protein
MTFQITALDPAPFAPLFAMSDAELAARNARRVIADSAPGFPCRVSVEDAEPGETLILAPFEHLGGDTPYRQTHAVYVRQGAVQAVPAPGEVPLALRRRLLSVRAYDAAHQIIDADVIDGEATAATLDAMFTKPAVAFIHLHNARPGCFAAAAVRA